MHYRLVFTFAVPNKCAPVSHGTGVKIFEKSLARLFYFKSRTESLHNFKYHCMIFADSESHLDFTNRTYRSKINYDFPRFFPVFCRELVDHTSMIRWCQTLKLLSSSRKEVALRKGTFFEGMDVNFFPCQLIYKPSLLSNSGSRMEIQVILRLLHLWSTKTPVGKAQDELQVPKTNSGGRK